MTADITAESLTASLAGGISEVVSAIFENMLGLSVTLDGPGGAADSAVEFRSCVRLTGSWTGAVSIECSRVQARHFAARFLSLPPCQVPEQITRDVLGELTNMISGNAKPLLGPDIQLSVAAVSQGHDGCGMECKSSACEAVRIFCAEGCFTVKLIAAPTACETMGSQKPD